ncbi:MAG: PLD nuclease N-terminal domain-containing protein [Desulfococcaceae bacterium]
METVLFVAGAGLLFLLLTWWAIVDIALREFPSQKVKIGWGIAVALIPFAGCLVYFIFGTRMGKRRKETGSEAKK